MDNHIYDFDHVPSRRGTGSLKWDDCPDIDGKEVLPLWVADMDFPTAPCVIEALLRRVEHGVFGYTKLPDSYYESLVSWFSLRHGWTMRAQDVVVTTGVVPALSALVQALTKEGDGVIVQNPVYNCFFSSVRSARCEVLPSPLLRVGDSFRMDLDDLARKAALPRTSMLILCNPHNPAGRVWTREELTALATIARENDIFVVSDEIHCELTMPGHEYTPFGSLPPELTAHAAVCTSPSKAFNTAGLQIANITIPDPEARERLWAQINRNETCDLNPFGVVGLQAAYTDEGYQWLSELRQYIWSNFLCLRQFMREELPDIGVIDLQGTYLALLDCSALGLPSHVLEERLLREAHLRLNAGRMYDVQENPYLRINLACTNDTLLRALAAFRGFVRSLPQREG